jgi:NADH-quinone oxidoreductase subunit L
MTFEGEFRGGAEADPEADSHGGGVHLGESPRVMVGPLVVLGAASVLAGLFVNPPFDLGVVSKHALSDFLGAEAVGFNVTLAALTLAAALVVIGVAYVIYASDPEWARQAGRRLRPAHNLLSRKYYFDEAYEGIVVTRVLYGWLARALDWGDKAIVDGVVRDIDRLGRNVGRGIAQAQTGQLQGYGVAISVGVLAILGIYIVFR